MSWVILIIAGLFEMLGVLTISNYNQKKNARSLLLLFAAFTCSFLCLYLAMQKLPMGVAYAIWTGIGAAGGAVLGMVLFKESKNAKRILFIGVIISAVIGLKLVS